MENELEIGKSYSLEDIREFLSTQQNAFLATDTYINISYMYLPLKKKYVIEDIQSKFLLRYVNGVFSSEYGEAKVYFIKPE